MQAITNYFKAEESTDKGVNITVSKDLVSIANKAAPFIGAILAAGNSPIIFVAAGGAGFILADQLKFVNAYFDEIWNKLDLTMQILVVAAAFVAVYLSPLVAIGVAAFAGQRSGAYVRDHYQGWLQAFTPSK